MNGPLERSDECNRPERVQAGAVGERRAISEAGQFRELRPVARNERVYPDPYELVPSLPTRIWILVRFGTGVIAHALLGAARLSFSYVCR